MNDQGIITKLLKGECDISEIRRLIHHQGGFIRACALLALKMWMGEQNDFEFDSEFTDELIEIAADTHPRADLKFAMLGATPRLLAIDILRDIGTPKAVKTANEIADLKLWKLGPEEVERVLEAWKLSRFSKDRGQDNS